MSVEKNSEPKKICKYNKQLKAYSLAAGAILIASESANATIHHTDLGTGIIIDSTNSTFEIDFGNNDITNFIISLFAGTSSSTPVYTLNINPQTTGAYAQLTFQPYVNALNNGDQVNNTTASWLNSTGTGVLGARKHTYSGALTSFGSFPGTINKYIGVKFKLNSNVNYGWIQVKMPGDPSYSIITGYAYNDEDDGDITAGQIPEAGSLGLLALGAAGLSLWRKRRA
jgi:hypothetical protein